MKKKILILISLLICSILCFTACGEEAKQPVPEPEVPDKVTSYYSQNYYVTGYSKIEVLDGYEFDYCGDILGVFKKEVSEGLFETVIYNMDKQAIVATFTDTATKTHYIKNEDGFFASILVETVNEKIYATTTLYNVNGESFATDKASEISATDLVGLEYSELYGIDFVDFYYVNDEKDFFVFEDIIYTIDYKTNIITKTDSVDFINIENFDDMGNEKSLFKTDNYISYYIDGYMSTIDTYDKNLNFVNRFELPMLALNTYIPFSNGNYIIQSIYFADANSNEYDFFYSDGLESMKFNVETKLIDVKTGEVKDIECDYIFSMDMMMSSYMGPSLECYNFTSILDLKEEGFITDKAIEGFFEGLAKIENKNIVLCAKGFWINADGIIEEVEELFVGQDTSCLPTKTKNGYFATNSVNDELVILNAKGDIIKRIGTTESVVDYGSYCLINGNIYNSKFEKVQLPEDYNFYRYIDNKIVLEKDGKYYFFVVETKKIENLNAIRFDDTYEDVIAVEKENEKFDFYNFKGEKLASDVEYQLSRTGLKNSEKTVVFYYGGGENCLVNLSAPIARIAV